MLVADAEEPSWVTFAPDELQPFALRVDFHFVENERGEQHWLLVGQKVLPPPLPELAEWSPRHQRTLNANAFRYRRFAERLLDMRTDEAGTERAAMLALDDAENRKPTATKDLDGTYLLGLERDVQDRRESGAGLMEIALDRGMSRATLWRRLKEAERRGLVPR